MPLPNEQKNIPLILSQVREKLAQGGKLIILGKNALQEGTSKDQFRIIFQRNPQHVIVTTHKMQALEELGIEHINLDELPLKMQATFYDPIEGEQILLNALEKLECRLSESEFPEDYLEILTNNILFIDGPLATIGSFESHIETILTGHDDPPVQGVDLTKFPPSSAQLLADSLNENFDTVIHAIIEENRRIFGLVLDAHSQNETNIFKPIVDLILKHEEDYFQNAQRSINLSSILDELEDSNEEVAKARHQPDTTSWGWSGYLIVRTRHPNPFNELIGKIADSKQRSPEEEKLLKQKLSYQFLNAAKLPKQFLSSLDFVNSISLAIPRFKILYDRVEKQISQEHYLQLSRDIKEFIRIKALPFTREVTGIVKRVISLIAFESSYIKAKNPIEAEYYKEGLRVHWKVSYNDPFRNVLPITDRYVNYATETLISEIDTRLLERPSWTPYRRAVAPQKEASNVIHDECEVTRQSPCDKLLNLFRAHS